MKLFKLFQKKAQEIKEEYDSVQREKHRHCVFTIICRDYGNHDGICHFRSYVYNRSTESFDEIKSFASLFGYESYRFRGMLDEDILDEIGNAIDSRKLKMLRNAEHISIIEMFTSLDVEVGVNNYYCNRRDSNNHLFVKL